LSVSHGTLHKRKLSGGRKRAYRGKRKYEQGSFPIETTLAEPKKKFKRGKGGNLKAKILSDNYASVTDPKSGKAEKVEITRVAKNPANVDYDRRGVITKGAIIETSKGMARVTSRPGQIGMINAVLIKEEKEKS
jgi:small subunit ribosomal protein S8e